MSKKYTVYKHTSPSGKVYIGITSQEILNRRWQNGSGYRSQGYFHRAIEKYGWENIKHEILMEGLTKSEAEEKEILLIRQYRSNDPDYGYNIENGGNCFGTHSEETKRKISESQKGEKNHNFGKPSPMRGKKASPEAVEKNRLCHLGIPSKNKGKKMSDEQKAKLRGIKRSDETKAKLRALRVKPVMCIDSGMVFPSCLEAGRFYGVNRGSISNAALGKTKTAGGVRWKYV